MCLLSARYVSRVSVHTIPQTKIINIQETLDQILFTPAVINHGIDVPASGARHSFPQQRRIRQTNATLPSAYDSHNDELRNFKHSFSTLSLSLSYTSGRWNWMRITERIDFFLATKVKLNASYLWEFTTVLVLILQLRIDYMNRELESEIEWTNWKTSRDIAIYALYRILKGQVSKPEMEDMWDRG